MITFPQIESATLEFFGQHWAPTIGLPSPTWSEEYRFVGEIYNNQYQGCYVLMKEDAVIYVGSAVSKGRGRYRECGIGERFNAYLRWDKSSPSTIQTRVFKPRESISGVTAARTIGFPSGHGYLALALEAFLIARFKEHGLHNIRGVV